MSDEAYTQEEQVISRLLFILELGRNLKANSNAKPTELSAWSKILEIEDERDVIAGMLEVDRLITTVINLIEAHPDIDSELYLEHFGHNMPRLIHPINLRGQWEPKRSLISDTVIKELQICSHQYMSDTSWGEVPKTQVIKDLLDEVNALSNRLIFLDLNPLLKETLANHIEAARMAIVLYRINGVDGIRQAISTASGIVFHHQEEIKESLEPTGDNENDESVKSWWKDWNGLYDKATKAIKLAKDGKSLLDLWKDTGLPPPGS